MRKLLLGCAMPLACALPLTILACESDSSSSSGLTTFDSGTFDGSGGGGGGGGGGGNSEGGTDGGGEGGEGGPAAFTTAFNVAMTGTGACAVFTDGRMKCWGGPQLMASETQYGTAAGQMGAALPYVTTSQPVRKVVGDEEAGFCAIFADGSVRCWDAAFPGQLNAGPYFDALTTNIDLGVGHSAVDVSMSETHTCVVLEDHQSIKCWGEGANGHLGTGSLDDLATPAATSITLGTGRTVKAITVSLFVTCALLDNDRVKCWGLGSGGLLANGAADDIGGMPNQMGDALAYAKLGTDPNTGAPWTVKKVLAVNNHACAILANDRVKCWGGSDNSGVLGTGDNTTSFGVDLVDDAIPFIDVGTDPNTAKPWTVSDFTLEFGTACVIIPEDGGRVRCWGSENGVGAFGIGATGGGAGSEPGQMGDNLIDALLKPGRTPTALYSSAIASCALVAPGVLNCWGRNNSGVLGQGLPDSGTTTAIGDDPSEVGASLVETLLQ